MNSYKKMSTTKRTHKKSKRKTAKSRETVQLLVRRLQQSAIILITLGLIITLCTQVYGFFSSSSYFTIKDDSIVIVPDAGGIDLAELRSRIKVPLGSSIFEVDLDSVYRAVIEHPRVSKEFTKVLRQLPDRIEVLVHVRQPEFTVMFNERFYNIDHEGIILDEVGFFRALKPFITGLPDQKAGIGSQIDDQRLKNAVRLIEILKMETDICSSVSEINCQDEENIKFYVYNDYNKGVEVYIGGSSFKERLARLEANWKILSGKGAAIKTIDLRYENQIPVRFREVTASNG
jgi:cell division septal protein FtsQ